MLMIKGGER